MLDDNHSLLRIDGVSLGGGGENSTKHQKETKFKLMRHNAGLQFAR